VQNQRTTSRLLIISQVLFAVIVFILDVLSPRGVAAELLYILLVLSGILSPQLWYSLSLAAISTLLTFVGLVLSPQGAPLWMALVNRSLVLFTVWATALLVVMLKRSERALRHTDEQGGYPLSRRADHRWAASHVPTAAGSVEGRGEDGTPASVVPSRDLLEGIPAVIYIAAANEQASTLYVSPQIERMLGFASADWLTDQALWMKQLHPDDKDRVLHEYARAVAHKERFSSEYRLLRRDGRTIWVQDQAAIILGKDGQPVCVQGALLDITAIKERELALRYQPPRAAKGLHIAYLAFIELDVANACLIHTREISEQLALLGHDVTLILPNPLRSQRWNGVTHVWVRWWGFDRLRQLTFYLESFWHLVRLHRERRFDALYMRELLQHPFFPWLLRRLGIPYFVEVNGWTLDDMRFLGASEAELRTAWRSQWKLLAPAAGVIVSTAGNATKVVRYYGIPAKRVFVQELGTNLQLFTPEDKRWARQSLGLPLDAQIILFAGSFHPHHDLRTVVDAFAQLAGEDKRLLLLLLGYGATWDDIQKQCRSAGIADQVVLPGSRPYEEMPQYFQTADIAVLPLSQTNIRQRNGCITLKLWDYMAAGLPVLVTDLPHTPSAVLLKEKAYRVQPEDSRAMAAGLRDLLAHRDLRARLGAAGLDYVRKHRTWRHAADETIQFMQARLAEVAGHAR
jgi:PAS domain S-box-containing protein